MNVNLHIERLILEGISPRDRQRIGRAMQRELTRLFTEQGIPASLTAPSSIHRLAGGDCPMAADADADAVGVQVAQSVYRGMSE